MEGVEILATEEVAISFKWSFTFCWIPAIITCIFIFLISTYVDNNDLIFGIVIGIFSGIVVGFLAGHESIPVEYETRYDVTISEDVSLIEFEEKYEIIDQNGKIYTVREK